MRLIDADALKTNIEQSGGEGTIARYCKRVLADCSDIDAPTIDAIPVEWLKEHEDEDIRDSDGNSYGRRKITVVEALSIWQKEQETR